MKVYILYVSLLLNFFIFKSQDLWSEEMQDNNGYYFVMDDESKKIFLLKLSTVSFDETPQEIISKLGLPKNDNEAYSKEMVDGKGKFLFRIMTYYLKRWDRDSVNEIKDQEITFYFDKENHLVTISSSVPEVPSRERSESSF